VLGADGAWHATPVAGVSAGAVTLSGAPAGAKAVRFIISRARSRCPRARSHCSFAPPLIHFRPE
jgi:hypothetical protein